MVHKVQTTAQRKEHKAIINKIPMENTAKTTHNIQPETPPSVPQSESPSPQVPKGTSKTLWYVGGIVVLVIIGGFYFLPQKPKTTPLPAPQPAIQQPTITPTSTLPRSKAPGIITNVVTASALNAQGAAASISSSFTKTDSTIYLVLTVNKPKVGTKIEYIRYLNGKYLDSGTNKILKPNVSYTSFVWSLKKPGAAHLLGTYKVKVYTNGIFEKETSYIVQ